MMCGATVVVFVMLVYTQLRITTARIKKISTAMATYKINHENGLFVDIRASKDFSKGHIAGSENVSAAEIKQGKVQRIGSAKDRPVIIVGRDKFDSECFHSARLLKKQGFKKVFTLDGGITQWSTENLPLSFRN